MKGNPPITLPRIVSRSFEIDGVSLDVTPGALDALDPDPSYSRIEPVAKEVLHFAQGLADYEDHDAYSSAEEILNYSLRSVLADLEDRVLSLASEEGF